MTKDDLPKCAKCQDTRKRAVGYHIVLPSGRFELNYIPCRFCLETHAPL